MKQHTPEEIVTILREADMSNESVADFCRRKGIAEAAIYLEQNVAVDESIGHPDLESNRATLERVRKKLNLRPSG